MRRNAMDRIDCHFSREESLEKENKELKELLNNAPMKKNIFFTQKWDAQMEKKSTFKYKNKMDSQKDARIKGIFPKDQRGKNELC